VAKSGKIPRPVSPAGFHLEAFWELSAPLGASGPGSVIVVFAALALGALAAVSHDLGRQTPAMIPSLALIGPS